MQSTNNWMIGIFVSVCCDAHAFGVHGCQATHWCAWRIRVPGECTAFEVPRRLEACIPCTNRWWVGPGLLPKHEEPMEHSRSLQYLTCSMHARAHVACSNDKRLWASRYGCGVEGATKKVQTGRASVVWAMVLIKGEVHTGRVYRVPAKYHSGSVILWGNNKMIMLNGLSH